MENTDIEAKVGAHTGHEEFQDHDESHLKRRHVVQGQVQAAHLYREDAQGKVIERLLVPRPTDDPKDPLTWSSWRKHTAFIIISFFVFLSNYSTASLSPAIVPLIKEFNITPSKASYLNTFNILFLGLGNLFWVPISLKIGKRPVLILCLTIFFSSCVWNAKAQSWGSMLGARILQGFGASASEALGPAVVADLFFVHERGAKVGFYGIMIAGGSSLGGIFAGLVINANQNWHWIFWMDSIVVGTCLVLTILFLPETNFKRPADSEISEGSESGMVKSESGRSNYSWRNALSVTGYYDRYACLQRF
jgi:MFS family permease